MPSVVKATALVNGDVITQTDVDQRMAFLFPQMRKDLLRLQAAPVRTIRIADYERIGAARLR